MPDDTRPVDTGRAASTATSTSPRGDGPDGVNGADPYSRDTDNAREAHLESELEAGELGGQLTAVTEPVVARKKKGPGVLFWAALVWVGLVIFLALFASVLPFKDPNLPDIPNKLAAPFGDGGILGNDGLGRDVLARLAFGARVSLQISFAAVAFGILVGGTLGMLAGYYRGKFEAAVNFVINVIFAFPALILLLYIVAAIGQSLSAITIAISFLSVPIYTRVARATTLAVAQREYVLAARALGATDTRILFREIMPNVILPVAAFGLVALGTIIVAEGALAFLGLSVEAPAATWGSMIAEGKRHLSTTVWVALGPSLVMFLTVLSLNFVGDILRSRFDVKESAL
jgi:peptide/nickel transport system permease protein